MHDGSKPSDLAFYTDPLRSMFEMMTLPAFMPALRTLPNVDSHPVMVFPGFMAGDRSTSSLRNFLLSRGCHPHGWGQGTNLGARDEYFINCVQRIDELHSQHGKKVSLIGQSLGGIYARELAKFTPHARQVICLGSPADGRNGDGSRVSELYEMVNREYIKKDSDSHADQLSEEPPVPTTMIYSKQDGIVHWNTCTQKESPSGTAENVRVHGSHGGMGFNPAVYYIVADRLAQSEGSWRPFKAPKWLCAMYPDHYR